MRYWLLAMTALLLAATPLHAEDKSTAKVRAALNVLLPGQPSPDSITPAPVGGLYEVAYGTSLFYVSADGRYLMNGDLIDIKNQSNITEMRRGQARMKMVNSLDAASMIVYPANGKAKHSVTIFTDIDCTYCRKLHHGMKEMNDLGISVRYMAYPRAGIPSASYDKAVSVWCAKDRNKAMDMAKNEDKIAQLRCDNNPIRDHLAMGQALGVNGTPAILMENGSLIPGYLPPQRLLLELEKQNGPKQ